MRTEQELLTKAFEVVRSLLNKHGGDVDLRRYPVEQSGGGREAAWEVTAPNYPSTLLVEA